MRYGPLFGLGLCLLMFFHGPSSAEMYKWIDDQGRVHYGDKPRDKASATELKPEPKRLSQPSPSAETVEPKTKKPATATGPANEQEQRQQLEKFANMTDDQIREHLEAVMREFENSKQNALKELEKDKERARLLEEERQKRFEEAERKKAAWQKTLEDQLESAKNQQRKGYHINKDGIVVDSNGKRANYHSDYLDGRGNPIDADGNIIGPTGKVLPGGNVSAKKRERKFKKAIKQERSKIKLSDEVRRQRGAE